MSGMDIFQIWVGALVTLALFSFLYKDNPFYKVAEHIFAGLSAGYYWGLIWQSVIVQQLYMPLVNDGKWTLIFPALLGILMFTRFFSKLSWISRISLAFVMGNTAGVFLISQLHGLVLPQMGATMRPLVDGGFAGSLLAFVVVVGVISTLIYFYFSKEHVGALGVTAKIGIWFIMISFGAHFGYTVMGRISLLIGRVYFLYNDWIGSFSHIL